MKRDTQNPLTVDRLNKPPSGKLSGNKTSERTSEYGQWDLYVRMKQRTITREGGARAKIEVIQKQNKKGVKVIKDVSELVERTDITGMEEGEWIGGR